MTERRAFVPRLMRISDAAYYVGLSETRFRELVNDGRICGKIYVGRSVMWDVAELDRYIDSLPRDGNPANDDWKDVAL